MEFWKETAIAIHILSNDIDLTACGGQSEDRESDLCDDRSLGEIPECCPEPCCGDVKGYFMII